MTRVYRYRKIKPYGRAYMREKREIQDAYFNPYPCAECGHPVHPMGQCHTCGNENPEIPKETQR